MTSTILGRKVTTVTPGERRCTVDFGALEAGYAYLPTFDGSTRPPFNWWIKVRAHEHRGAPIDGSARTEPEAIEAIERALLAMRDAIPGRQREPAAAVDLEAPHSLLQSLDAAKLADNGVVIARVTLAALIAELEQLRAVAPKPGWCAEIQCPDCGCGYEGHEVEMDGDDREMDCFFCGATFDVLVSVERSYQCSLRTSPPEAVKP